MHQIPVVIYPDENNVEVVMTRNPMFSEVRNGVLTFYFLPEDSNAVGNGSDELRLGADAAEHTFSTIYVVETKNNGAVDQQEGCLDRSGRPGRESGVPGASKEAVGDGS